MWTDQSFIWTRRPSQRGLLVADRKKSLRASPQSVHRVTGLSRGEPEAVVAPHVIGRGGHRAGRAHGDPDPYGPERRDVTGDRRREHPNGGRCSYRQLRIRCPACPRSTGRLGLLALAAVLWATGHGYDDMDDLRIPRNHDYSCPSLADVFFLSYVVPAIAGLLQFRRVKDRLASRLRTLLDVSVIALRGSLHQLGHVLRPPYLAPAGGW